MDFLKFLGTGGARIVVSKQIRHTGGIWLSLCGENFHIDPGPGALIRALSAKKPKLDPLSLSAIILSHKHLDHSGDINIMIEAMTEGGMKKRGILVCPKDALEGEDPIIFKYIRSYPKEIKVIQEGEPISFEGVEFNFLKHKHDDILCYGMVIKTSGLKIGYITDTKFFDEILSFYKGCNFLIICVLREKPREDLPHLSIEDAERIIKETNPEVSILTHFGMTMIKANPQKLADALSSQINKKVIAAYDGMLIELKSENWCKKGGKVFGKGKKLNTSKRAKLFCYSSLHRMCRLGNKKS